MENKTISKQIAKIIQLCYQINSVETNQEKTGNLPTVFLDFMGHTCQLNVRVYDDGWMSGEDPDYSTTIYLNNSPNGTTPNRDLDLLIEFLNVCLKSKARKEKKLGNAKM